MLLDGRAYEKRIYDPMKADHIPTYTETQDMLPKEHFLYASLIALRQRLSQEFEKIAPSVPVSRPSQTAISRVDHRRQIPSGNFLSRSIIGYFSLGAASLLLCAATLSAATVSDSSTLWTTIPGNYDFFTDQQTGQTQGDIVGSTNDPGFFTTFNSNGNTSNTDGTLGFRLRLDKAGNANQFDRVAWIGIDADLNGSLDAFVGVNYSGSTQEITIRDAGAGANNSPSTTTISNSAAFTYTPSATNYNYRPVNFSTDGGTTNDSTGSGDPDYYLSFLINFADLVSFLGTQQKPDLSFFSINDSTSLRYVLATSTNVNALNQDLGGINGMPNGASANQTWTQLGGFSPVLPIPEPSSAMLVCLTNLFFLLRRKR
jgi:hypothetical protein